MAIEIWHNPRCSKSRAALRLLRDSGREVRVRRYLEEPPSVAELERVLARLGVEPRAITRLKEPLARELRLRERPLDRSEWLRLLVDNPRLIERPIVLADDGRAVLGRPPERVRELLAG